MRVCVCVCLVLCRSECLVIAMFTTSQEWIKFTLRRRKLIHSRSATGDQDAEKTKKVVGRNNAVGVCVESVLWFDGVIELRRTDVSITSSYLRLQNNPINLDRVYTGSQV